MLIANDYENEVKLQKLKMKEMEDYLDNLLLRVMETQPKLLQNPYRDQTSTKRYFFLYYSTNLFFFFSKLAIFNYSVVKYM